MKPRITTHLLFCLALFLLSKCSGTGEPSAPSPLPTESPPETVREQLVRLGIGSGTVAKIDDAKLKSLERVFDHFPQWFGRENPGAYLSVKCELCWFLGAIEFDEAVDCVAENSKVPEKLGVKRLVNAFADRHTFELEQIAIQGGSYIEDETELRRRAKGLVSLEGAKKAETIYLFLQHSLKLLRKDPTSLERRDMLEHMMTLHLSAYAAAKNSEALGAIYAGLKVNVPTLFYADLPSHAAAVAVTLRSNDTYDVVLINSGYGISNHQAKTIQAKGFHKAQESGTATAYVPTMEFKGITKQQLEKANYHSGSINQVYYKDQPEVKAVEKQHLLPWEITDTQAIGSCTVSSIWYTLRFYYQALIFENDIRLSLLEQAISETAELQSGIQKVEDKIDVDYVKRREISITAAKQQLEAQGVLKTAADYNKRLRAFREVPYHSDTAKALWDEKEKLQNRLRIRRELIAVGLNGILQYLITLFHELEDIRAKAIFWSNKRPQSKRKSVWVAKKKLEKVSLRTRLLEKAIPKIMTSFHAFWAEQKQRCASSAEDTEIEKQGKILKCMTWGAVEEDTRTLYGDAVRLVEGKGIELVGGQLGTRSVKGGPLKVTSLPIHESLRLLLDRIVVDGDSESLRKAIDEHLRLHFEHRWGKDASYLLVLYAALKRSAPLLDHLVSVKGLPLLYYPHAIVPKDGLMLLSDLKLEADIPRFAALEFKKYGQPLDNFPQIFTLTSNPAKRIVGKFVQLHRRSIPPANYDAAIFEFAESCKLALLACAAPKASEQARADLFMKSDDIRVLSILLVSISDEQLYEKMSEAVANGSGEIVQFLFPHWLRMQRRIYASKTAKEDTIIPDEMMDAALGSQSLEVLQQLLPYCDRSDVDKYLLGAASKGHTGVALLLAEYSSSKVPSAVAKAIWHRHFKLATTLVRLYPSKQAIKNAFSASAKYGHPDLIREFIGFVEITDIDVAMTTAAQRQKFEIVEILLEHASQEAIQKAARMMIGEDSASPVFAKALTYISDSLITLIKKASKTADHKALQALLPFMTLDSIENAFSKACADNNTAIVSLLSSFAKTQAADSCFEELVEQESTPSELLEGLVPHMSRKAVLKVYKSPKRDGRLNETARAAIETRVKGFPAEIAFLHAFRVESKGYSEDVSEIAQSEADECGIELPPLCATPVDCISTIEPSRALVSTATVEEVIDSIKASPDEIAKAVPHLLSFATPFICTYLLESSADVSLVPAFVTVCAEKALKPAVFDGCELAVSEEKFEVVKALIPHISPSDVLSVLRLIPIDQQFRINAILSQSQVDSVLSFAIRQQIKHFDGEDTMLIAKLLDKASKPVVNASLLYVMRCELPRKKYVEKLSQQATDEGREAAGQVIKQIS